MAASQHRSQEEDALRLKSIRSYHATELHMLTQYWDAYRASARHVRRKHRLDRVAGLLSSSIAAAAVLSCLLLPPDLRFIGCMTGFILAYFVPKAIVHVLVVRPVARQAWGSPSAWGNLFFWDERFTSISVHEHHARDVRTRLQ